MGRRDRPVGTFGRASLAGALRAPRPTGIHESEGPTQVEFEVVSTLVTSSGIELVPEAGLEPAQGYPYRILSSQFHFSGSATAQYPSITFKFRFPCCLVVLAVFSWFEHRRCTEHGHNPGTA